MYLDETQNQYKECFAQASKQESLLELQRQSIDSLKKDLIVMDCNRFLSDCILHIMFFVIIFRYQNELDSGIHSFESIKSQMSDLQLSKRSIEEKYWSLQNRFDAAIDENEKSKSLLIQANDDLKRKQRDIDSLTFTTQELQEQLVRYKQDFEGMEIELKKLKSENSSISDLKLRNGNLNIENQKLCADIKCFQNTESNYKKILEDLENDKQFFKRELSELKKENNEKESSLEKYKLKILHFHEEFISKSEKIKKLKLQCSSLETIIKEQSVIMSNFKERLSFNEEQLKDYCCELKSTNGKINAFKNEIFGLKYLLKQKFDYMMKLQADYQIIKNENDILKAEQLVEKDKHSEDMCILRHELNNSRYQLVNYKQNYEKLLQECHSAYGLKPPGQSLQQDVFLPDLEKCYCEVHSDGMTIEKYKHKIQKLGRELEETKAKLSSKCEDINEIQNQYCSIASKLESFERNNQRLKDNIMLLEKSNNCYKQKLQNCTEKNTELIKQNQCLEDSNNRCMNELEEIVLQISDMQKCLSNLKEECDKKTESLADVSAELSKATVNRSEMRYWMKEQKKINDALNAQLHLKNQKILKISSDKRDLRIKLKKVRMRNVCLTRFRKTYISRNRDFCSSSCYSSPRPPKFNRIALFKKKTIEGQNSLQVSSSTGSPLMCSQIEHLCDEFVKADLFEDINGDCGYQTSASK